MTATDQLIRELAARLEPLPRGIALRRLAFGASFGAVVSLVLFVGWLGAPFEAVNATGGAAFAMKLLYCVALGAVSYALLFILGSPGRSIGKTWLWILLAPVLVGASALVELASVAPQEWSAILSGSTWHRCLVAVSLMSVPVLAAIFWGMRRLAPTRLRLTGLVAGLAAGSTAAALYALYCPETTATFLLGWYSLGILIAGTLGVLSGPRLLRW